MYYNIHNIVGVKSNTECLPDYFKSKKLDPDIIIKEGDFNFKKDNRERIGLKFYGGDNKIYLEYSLYGTQIQKLLIEDLLGKTKFYFTKRTNKIFNVANIIRLLLEIKLLQRGCTLVHAGAVSKNNKGYLFTAWSEMGKSSTVFALSGKSGFKVLGDDSVILSKNGTIYAYPVKAGIYFHSKNVESLDLSIGKRIELMLKFLVSKLPPLYLYIDPNLRIDISKITEVGTKAKLNETYLLEWGKGVEKINRKSAIQKLFTTTYHFLFGNFFIRETFMSYCYANDFDPNYIEKNMMKVLNSAVGNCRIIRSEKKDYYKYLETKAR